MAIFLASSLSNLFNNLAKGFHKIKYKYDEKKIETCGVKYCFLEYTNFKANLTEYKCLCCNKNFQKKIDENLKKRFLIHTNFLIMISISLFYCCGKVFALTWKRRFLLPPKHGKYY